MGHKKEALRGLTVYGLCCYRAVSAAVRPLCAVGLSGSCQAVTLGPDSDGTPLMSGSAVRLSDTCCQAVRESAVNAVRLSGTVRRCPGLLSGCQTRAQRLVTGPPHSRLETWAVLLCIRTGPICTRVSCLCIGRVRRRANA